MDRASARKAVVILSSDEDGNESLPHDVGTMATPVLLIKRVEGQFGVRRSARVRTDDGSAQSAKQDKRKHRVNVKSNKGRKRVHVNSSGSDIIVSSDDEGDDKYSVNSIRMKLKPHEKADNKKKRAPAKSTGSEITLSSDEDDDCCRSTRSGKIVTADKRSEPRNTKQCAGLAAANGEGSFVKEENKKEPAKDKKRICVRSSGSDMSDGDETDGPNARGAYRKNIRRMMSKSEMTRATLDAQATERERKKRIARLQEMYNATDNTAVDAGGSAEDQGRKLILEKDDESAVLVEVHPTLVQELKPHQMDGIRFLYTSIIESICKLDQPPGGCILAHCMGLGKTLQVIAFLHTVLTNERFGIRTALVLAPVNVVLNWKQEFERWTGDALYIRVWEMTSMKTQNDRLLTLENWQTDGGVMIMGYDMFRSLSMGNYVKKEDARKRFEKALLHPGADIVVCDEGHILKNEKTGISQVVNRVKTARRVCLTGTPLQNNLTEYHCMVQFVKPNLLGSKSEFKNRFGNPIKNGQCVDSTSGDVGVMKKRAHILHSLLDGCVHRRDYSALAAVLPPKQEYIISVRLADKQIELYKGYLENIVGDINLDSLRVRKSLFADFQTLQRVWTHPLALYLHQVEVERKVDENNFIDNEYASASASSSESDASSTDAERKPDDEPVEVTRRPRTRQNPGEAPGVSMLERIGTPLEHKRWWNGMLSENDYSNVDLSGKLVLLIEILKKCEEIGDKLLVFSQSLNSLAVIEKFLSCDDDGSTDASSRAWRFGIDYFRIDGSTSAHLRRKYIERFNDPSNLQARLFLISTKAGSLGTNLVGANRVIIFDASWNPSHDIQAIFRVYRYGQTKPVYVYRFIAQGSMEERIYDRQVTKQSLALRVVDEQQIERHFSAADLEELYRFEPTDLKAKENLPMLAPPKDLLLKEVMFDKGEWFIAYHEHDSLLQHREDENLTEEEKHAAWDEYKAEREGRKHIVEGSQTDPLVACFSGHPQVKHWIDAGNKLIIESGEMVSTKLEHVCATWLRDNPDLALSPDLLLVKLQDLVKQLESAVEQKRRSEAQTRLDRWVGKSILEHPLYRPTPTVSGFPPYGEPLNGEPSKQ